MEESAQTDPQLDQSGARTADLLGGERGGGAPWPCRTPSGEPPAFCAGRSEGEDLASDYNLAAQYNLIVKNNLIVFNTVYNNIIVFIIY